MTEPVDPNESRDASVEKNTDQATTKGQTNEPAIAPKAREMISDPAPAEGAQDEGMIDAPAEPDVDADSEAETLIQSPEKQRTTADNASVAGSGSATRTKDEDSTVGATATENDNKSRKRKRSIDDAQDDPTFSTSSHRSSSLSSPGIPPHSPDSDSDVSNHIASQNPKPARRKRENDTADSDDPEEKSVKIQTRKRRPSDILPPVSKHRTKNSSGGVDPERRETRSATYPRHSSQDRSPSPRPQRREHRRGVSTQITLGDVERKKRGRPPAIHTKRSGSADINCDRSSSLEDSDSPEQSRPSLHKFSSVDHDTMSPAKVTGPRKWRDKNGRTFLSRAASNNDVATAKIRFAERPEDLNQPDNAGNTPLQIAALQGYVGIVRFLLENGCDVDTRNIDRDTALIDAVENGHVEVVKLLLDFGANPRLGNAKGDEPYELVPQDDENYEEIRRLLADAKEKSTNRRISSDHNDAPRDGASSRAASAASPRDSPPMMGPTSPPAGLGRRRTGRSESTRNDLLWQANTQENLKKLAAQGDVQGVANILNVLQKAETESLIAAAKAGHEEVLQYLLAMGDTEPDPDPIRHLRLGYNTPLLAAIGRGHPEVVKLLVEQSGFNPMRRLLKGKTYFEVSAERRGEQWQKEYGILKTAYEKYAVKHRKATSPRATRDGDKLKARANRRSQSPISSKLRNSSSPTLTHKHLPGKSPRSSEKEKDRDTGSVDGGDRRKHPVSKREMADSSVAVSSDQDQTVHALRKGHMKRRSQSDLPQPPNLESDITHRRRRLVTGKEHRRRKSIVEINSEEDMIAVKAEGKPSTVLKRTRESVSPGPTVTEEGENGRSAAKKRRTIIESSPEETRPGPKRSSNQSSSPVRQRKALEEDISKGGGSKSEPPVQPEPAQVMDINRADAKKLIEATDVPITAAPDSNMPLQRMETTEPIKTEPLESGPSEAELRLQREEEARKAEEAKRLEEERVAAERAAEERRLAEEAERHRKAEEEAALKKKEEDERLERIRRELEERQRRHEEQLKEQQRRLEEQLREQQRQERIAAEQRRRDALPALLKHCALLIDNNDPKARSEAWLKLFLPLYTVKSVQLNPDTPDVNKNDLWIPNFQVAGLLVTKDLNLRNYTSLETRPVTLHQRQRLWGVTRNSVAYEFQTNQWNTTIKQAIQREQEERPKFYAMEELFWVKLSDFEDQIFRHPHLSNLSIRKQSISLRIIPSRQHDSGGPSPQSPASLPDFTNGKSPQLTNGISSHTSPNVNGNGIGYTRRED